MNDRPVQGATAVDSSKSRYVIDMPETPRVYYWVAGGLSAISIIGLVVSFFLMNDTLAYACGILLVSVPVAVILADFFVKVPIALERSLRISSNLAMLKDWRLFDFLFSLRLLAIKHDRSFALWIIVLFLPVFFLALMIEPEGAITALLTMALLAGLVYLFILESGILASMFGKIPYSSIPVFLFWTVPVLVLVTWGSIKFGEQIAAAPIAAHVDTKYVPNYWQASVPGVGRMQVTLFCCSILIAWMITATAATLLFKRLVGKRICEFEGS